MGGLLATELDPAAILDEVVSRRLILLGADACAIRVARGRRARRQRRRRRAAPSGARGRGCRATAGPAGDVVQSRAPVASRGRRATIRACVDDDPVLAAGHTRRTWACRSSGARARSGVLAVYSRRPRTWREEEIEALLALAGERVGRALERRALPAGRARARAQLRDPREHRRRDRRRRPRGRGRALERGGGADHRRARPRGARPHAARGAPARARVGRATGRTASGSSRSARRRGGLAVADRGGHARSGGRGRRPDLRLPRHLGRADRRADEVGLRLDRLARAAGAADLDLRLRGDAAAPGRRSSATTERQTFLGYIASRGAAADRRSSTRCSTSRGSTRATCRSSSRRPTCARSSPRSSRASRRPRRERAQVRRSTCRTSRSRPRPTARSCARSSTNLLDNAVKFSPGGGTVTVEAHRRSGDVEVRVVDEGIGHPAGRARADLLEVLPRPSELASERAAPGSGCSSRAGSSRAMGGRIWVDSGKAGARASRSSCRSRVSRRSRRVTCATTWV